MKLKSLKAAASKLLEQYRHSNRIILSENASLAKMRQHANDVACAREIVQSVAQLVQQKAHDQIAGVVTKCLQAVFDDPYKFRIIFEQKKGRTDARLVFIRNGHEIDPTSAAGGGVLDVAAFALRLSCLVLAKPRKRRLLVLDEPFRFVSRDLSLRISSLLQTLSNEFGIQFIIVTHSEELGCGKVIRL